MTTASMRIEQVTQDGQPCLSLDAGGPRVVVTTTLGPRILAMTLPNGTGEGLFASLPGLAIETPGQPSFHMRGGHRLWAAPEVPAVTYVPDDAPPTVERAADSVAFGVRGALGVRKTLRVQPTAGSVVVDHVLSNDGTGPVELAPWAITMLTPGGEAWLPRWMGSVDPGGYQASGSLALWPYTRLADPRLAFGDPIIRVLAVAGAEGRVKVGLQGRVGWAAYRRHDALFVKRATWAEGERYADLGASLQCYSCGDFIEVETLGPLVTLEVGASVVHRETWELHRIDPGLPMAAVLERVGLA